MMVVRKRIESRTGVFLASSVKGWLSCRGDGCFGEHRVHFKDVLEVRLLGELVELCPMLTGKETWLQLL